MLAGLQEVLAREQKDLFFVSEAAFLTEADLEDTEIPYAQFVQKQVQSSTSYLCFYYRFILLSCSFLISRIHIHDRETWC